MAKWAITIVLSCIVLALSATNLRLWFRHYLQNLQIPEQSPKGMFWHSASISFIRGIALIGILLVWNSLAWELISVLILLNLGVSILVGISNASPVWLSRWWQNIRKR
jgi:Sec-independent protein secretion pathway component TatC